MLKQKIRLINCVFNLNSSEKIHRRQPEVKLLRFWSPFFFFFQFVDLQVFIFREQFTSFNKQQEICHRLNQMEFIKRQMSRRFHHHFLNVSRAQRQQQEKVKKPFLRYRWSTRLKIKHWGNKNFLGWLEIHHRCCLNVFSSLDGPLEKRRRKRKSRFFSSSVDFQFDFKGSSPANSGTIESVFFDENLPEKIIAVQQLTTPETLKLDLLLQTKSLSEKVKENFR